MPDLHYLTIKERPAQNRPYERCRSYGPAALTDSELLAVILRTGRQGASAIEVAEEILALSPTEKGLRSLLKLTESELMSVPGVGEVKAVQLLCIGELSRRIARMKAEEKLLCNVPSTVADCYMEELRHKEQENLVILMLDGSSHRITERVMTVGTVNASLVSPREIFLEALRCHAVSIIMLHNHPSGDPTPSPEDYEVTEKVREAGELLHIPLVDHIIIGDRTYRSFCEDGFL